MPQNCEKARSVVGMPPQDEQARLSASVPLQLELPWHCLHAGLAAAPSRVGALDGLLLLFGGSFAALGLLELLAIVEFAPVHNLCIGAAKHRGRSCLIGPEAPVIDPHVIVFAL